MAGDEVYGNDPALRAELEARRVGYVLAIGCDRRVPTAAGPIRADALTAALPRRAWQRLSAGAGAKGQRYYDWAWVSLIPPASCAPSDTDIDTASWWLLVRRHRDTGELAFYRCYCRNLSRCASWSGSPDAGRRTPPRWTVEESFQASKAWPGSTSTPPSRSRRRDRCLASASAQTSPRCPELSATSMMDALAPGRDQAGSQVRAATTNAATPTPRVGSISGA